MGEVLKLAREIAAKDLSWTKAVVNDRQRILAAQATLDAIDAAIAAERPAKVSKGIRIPFVADTSGLKEALAKATLNRVDLEIDLDRPSIRVSGDGLDVAKVVAFLLEQGKDLATGGIATGKAPFGLVGERAGESVVGVEAYSADMAPLIDSSPAARDEVGSGDEWTMFGRRALPQLGEQLEFTQTSKDGAVQRSLVRVVEIWENADEGLLGKLTQRELEQIPASERTVYWVRHRNGEENAVAIDNLRRL